MQTASYLTAGIMRAKLEAF